ncbi:LacI family DNA-binding transcriptional regulator [Rapidithrix thailandica]|uniref:LacI family DNA-binding transcriptional regulator n=1 Tax=Rapidithrix thailandica TaxID=413964 RepID=A0AAW9SBU0_9BACT
MQKRNVTIVDIAKELNLSPSTVSRALNDVSTVKESTKKEVLKLAELWGYVPNIPARNLLIKKTYNLGLIVPDVTHNFFSKAIKGIDEVVSQAGYQLVICSSNDDVLKEKKAAETLLHSRVDGLLVSLCDHTKEYGHFEKVIKNQVPIVFIDRICEDLAAPSVITNDFEGAYQATDYLIQTACKKIAYLKGPDELSTSFYRQMGYMESLKNKGLNVNENLLVDWEDLAEQRAEKFHALLDGPDRPDGVFAYNDYIAFEFVQAVKQNGLRIPEDVSVIGFADEPVATYMTPALSTVFQPALQMGKSAAQLLLTQIEEDQLIDDTTSVVLNTNLVLRETTRPLERT